MPQTTLPATDLPCEVQTVMSARCWACHGETPTTVGMPSLTSVAAFMAPSRTDPSQAIGAVAAGAHAVRHQPDAAAAGDGGDRAEESPSISGWVASGYPTGSRRADLHERHDLDAGQPRVGRDEPGLRVYPRASSTGDGPVHDRRHGLPDRARARSVQRRERLRTART